MNIIDKIKPFLGENANITELTTALDGFAQLTPEAVKAWIAQETNKPTFDSIVGKSISSHIEKEKASRADWEASKASELLEEAKAKIAKDAQKSPEMIKIEELQAKLQSKETSELNANIKASLLDIIKEDKLPIAGVDPFVGYGDNAETELRKFAQYNDSLINDMVKKQLADKYGKGNMQNENTKIDDKPVSPEDHISGIFNKGNG